MTGQNEALSDVQNSLLLDLIGQSPLPITVARLKSTSLVYLSPGFIELFGYTAEDVPTYNDWYRVAYPDPDRREKIRAEWEAATKAAKRDNKKTPAIMASVTCKDGSIREIEFVAAVSSGHMITVFTDVTERVRAEEALRESERYNRMLFESSPVGLALNRLDGSFVDVNAAFSNITGYSAEETLARGYRALTPDDYAEEEARQMAILHREGRFGPYEKEFVHKAGHRVPVRLSGVFIEQDGEVYIWSSVEDISDKQQAETALRASEQRERARAVELETVLDSVPTAVFIAQDAACAVITGNPAAYELLGLPSGVNPSKTAAKGKQSSYRTMQNGVEVAPQDLPMQRAAATGKPISGYPMTILMENGAERHTLANVAPLFDAQGRPRGAVGIFVDITEQLKVETALRESEQRERARAVELEAVLDSVPLPVFIAHDVACEVITGNRAAHEFFGIGQGTNPLKITPETASKSYRAVWSGVEIPLRDQPMQRAAASGNPIFEQPMTILSNDGRERHTLCNAAPLFDLEGKPRGAVGVLFDVTERLKTETALRESEQRERAKAIELETVLDSVPLPVFIAHDTACQVISANRAAQGFFGAPEGGGPLRIEGNVRPFRTMQNGVDLPLEDQPMQRAAASGDPIFGYPMTLLLSDGTECHTLCNAAPLFDLEGTPRGAVGVLVDITEQLKAETSLRESEQRERAKAIELETVLDSVPLPVFISYDVQCSVMTGNRAAYEFIGMPRDANPSLTAPEEQRPRYRTFRNGVLVAHEDHPMQRAAATGMPVVADPLTIIWEDGTVRQALNGAVPLFDAQGKPRGAVGISVDITKELEVKKALEDSLEQARFANEQLRFQFDHLPVAYIVWDSEFRVTAWNPAAERVFGWTSKEAVGRHAHELMTHAQVRDVVSDVWGRITQGVGKIEYSVNENVTRDGRTITCEWFNAPLHDNGGNTVGCLSMVNDISERIRAESQLQLAAEVFESCREAIVISDCDKHILAINPAFTEVTGYTPEDVLGQDSAVLLSAAPSSSINDAIRQAVLDKGHWQGEVMNRRKNGEVFPSLLSMSAIRDSEGKIINRIGFFIDLTERVAAETAVRQRTDQMVLVTDTLPFMVAYVDDQQRLTFMNREFEDVHGLSRETALGRRIDAVLPEDLRKHCIPQIVASLQGVRTQYEETVPLPRGGPRLCKSTFLPHRDNNKVVGVFIIIEDITDQRKAEDELRQSQKLQSIGTLAGGIAHDLNNLLTPIMGLTELVLDDLEDEQNIQSLQDVMSAADQAKRLVGQILAFSRKDAPNRQHLSLEPLIDKTIDLMRVAAPGNVTIIRDIQTSAQVNADETQMQQIVMNLCTNALQAMGRSGGDLLVSLRDCCRVGPLFYEKHQGLARGPYVEIVVQDTGCGMHPDTVSRIFEPFFTTKEVGEGTGMGLSVVHGIVTAHQGVIEVESEPGKGTTFRIFLPAVESAPALESAAH